MGNRPFYHRGLHFTCQQCHNCCRGGQPGWVYPAGREVQRIARRLKVTVSAFRLRFLIRAPDGEWSFRMRSNGNGDCIFWDHGCTIYAVRPRQCRTFPFWPDHLKSAEAWTEVQETCRGAGRGKLYRLEDIRSILHGRAT